MELVFADWHSNEIDFILQKYTSLFSTIQVCPPPLLAEIININHLRMRATTEVPSEVLSEEAYGILARVPIFSAENWANSKPTSEKAWTSIGQAHQAAVLLYCILSLRSVSILPQSPTLHDLSTTNQEFLYAILSEALPTQKTNRLLLWPLVVLGVAAVDSSPAMQMFVRE